MSSITCQQLVGPYPVIEIVDVLPGIVGFVLPTLEPGKREVTARRFSFNLCNAMVDMLEAGYGFVPEGTMPKVLEMGLKPSIELDFIIPLRHSDARGFCIRSTQSGMKLHHFNPDQIEVNGNHFMLLGFKP